MTHQSGTKDEDVNEESENKKMKAIKTETSPWSNLLPPFCIADQFVSIICHICNCPVLF